MTKKVEEYKWFSMVPTAALIPINGMVTIKKTLSARDLGIRGKQSSLPGWPVSVREAMGASMARLLTASFTSGL